MTEKEPQPDNLSGIQAFMQSLGREAAPLDCKVQPDQEDVTASMKQDPDGTIVFRSKHPYVFDPEAKDLSDGRFNPNNN